MSGKVTDNIIMRVGKGVVTIPRNSGTVEPVESNRTEKETGAGTAFPEHTKITDDSTSAPTNDSQEGCF